MSKHNDFIKPNTAEMEIVAQIFQIPQFLGLIRRNNILKELPVADSYCWANGGIVKVRENLAIIADVATILGVSIVGLIGTPLVSTLLGCKFSLYNFVNGELFYIYLGSAPVTPDIG